jgi:hypothetical protein
MPDQERLVEEGEWFDLMPAEKKLIGWSLGLGIALLGILVWISYTLVPIQH